MDAMACLRLVLLFCISLSNYGCDGLPSPCASVVSISAEGKPSVPVWIGTYN